METIGQRLRRLRTRRLMTQEELAAASKIPALTISRIENDHNAGMPRAKTVKALATALDVPAPYLMFGEEEEPPPG